MPKSLAIIAFCVAFLLGVAWVSGPAMVPLAVASMLVQWTAFVPAYLSPPERYYDITGTFTYLLLLSLALMWGSLDARSLLLAAMVLVWAVRLGTFLFRRIQREGKDGRFDDIKPDPGRFAVAWTLQGVWVFLTAIAALIAIVAPAGPELGGRDLVGLLLWGGGFGLEVMADTQKTAFRADPAHEGRFIDTGVWAWSRHPNYAGEITLWTGVLVLASSSFTQPGQWVALVSPVFIYLLLTRVSGVPMLEKRSDARWGGQPDYEAYKARTPVLWPRPPR